jgi:hypothetical protein
MTIVHKHILTICPNDETAQKIINAMREKLPDCKIHKATTAVSIEWYESMTTLKEGDTE